MTIKFLYTKLSHYWKAIIVLFLTILNPFGSLLEILYIWVN